MQLEYLCISSFGPFDPFKTFGPHNKYCQLIGFAKTLVDWARTNHMVVGRLTKLLKPRPC